MILSDRDLRYYIEKNWIKIVPFSEQIVRENGIDLRIGSKFAKLKKTSEVYDYKGNIEDFYEYENINEFIVNPHEHFSQGTYALIIKTTMGYIILISLTPAHRCIIL